MKRPEPTPIVCVPDALSPEERTLSATLRGRLANAIETTTEEPDGYSFRLRSDALAFQEAARWVTLERRCCPFLSFEMTWEVAGAPHLRIAGPEGAKEFLRAELPELPAK